jgi:hypothetical protein
MATVFGAIECWKSLLVVILMVDPTFGCYPNGGSYFWLQLNNDDDFNPHQTMTIMFGHH